MKPPDDIPRVLRARGWEVVRAGGGHLKARCPDACKCLFTMSATPGDRRASANNWSRIVKAHPELKSPPQQRKRNDMPKTLGEKGHEVYRVLADWLIGHPNQPFRVKEIGGDTYALSTKTHAWAQHTFTRLSGRTITSELSKYYEEVMHAHGGGLLFNTVPPDWKPGKNLDGCYVWDTAARVVDGAIVDNEFDVVHEHKVLQRARVWLPTTNGAARLVKPTEVPAVPAEPAPAVSSLPVKVAAHAPTEALSGPVTLMAAGDKRVILRVGGDVLVCRIEHQLSAMLEVN